MTHRNQAHQSSFRRLPSLAGACCLGLLAALAHSAAAQADDPIVVTVGDVSLKKSDVERRLREVPAFKLAQYGDTPTEQKRAFIERDLLPEILFSLDTDKQELARSPIVRAELNRAKLQALQGALREELVKAGGVTDADIEKYYKDNESRFKTPERIKIWRILLPSEEAAAEVLKQVRAKGDVKTWSGIAREKSLDKATHMRDGDLGFVLPDGRTNVPRVRVEPALFSAASAVKNGELVPKPVAEGKSWAVVWRRGSLAKVERSLETEAPNIRRLLERSRTDEQINALVAKLTAAHVSERHDELLESVDLDKIGNLGANRKPGLIDPHKPQGSVLPAPSSDQSAGAGER